MGTDRFVQAVLLGGAGFFLFVGAWALVDASSFYDKVASFPPYNRHFLHDAGAFQLGLGTALVLALTKLSGRVVVLWALTVASTLHAIAHAVDHHLGGRSSDHFFLWLMAAAFLAAALLATRKEVGQREAPSPTAGLRPHTSAGAPKQD